MNPSKLFELFDKAQRNLKFPSLTIQNPKIKLSVGNLPNTIWISNGLRRGDPFNKLYGKFSRTELVTYRNDIAELIPTLRDLCENPIKFGILHGRKYSHCCFCNTEL